MNLRITVITVCRNSVDTIERTFTSVLNQHYLPYEYIVIDGASNDGTLGIILKYQQLFEAKNVLFQYVSEPDKGLYDAMNKALPYVTGDWVHYLNSDDFYYDNKTLYNMSLFLAKTQKDIVAGNMFISSENKRTKLCRPSIIPRKLAMLFTCPFQQPATFVKATLMKNTRFDTAYRNSADYKLWVQLILEGIQYEYVNVNVTVFNVGGASAN
ncbi:glycosyltransferase family 2 protein, partial [Bacteroides fragilis]